MGMRTVGEIAKVQGNEPLTRGLKSAFFGLLLSLIVLQAHAQNYKPLASILTSKDLGDAGFSEAVVRCGALSSILKIKMDQVQAGGSQWDEISAFFSEAVNDLPEAKGSMVGAIQLLDPAMRYYYAQMNENNEKHNAMILGIVEEDMNTCIGFKKMLEDAAKTINEGDGPAEKQGTESKILTLQNLLSEASLSEESRQGVMLDITKQCFSFLAALQVQTSQVKDELKKIEGVPEDTIKAYQASAEQISNKADQLGNVLIAADIAKTGATKEVALERTEKILMNDDTKRYLSSDCVTKIKSPECTVFGKEIVACTALSDAFAN